MLTIYRWIILSLALFFLVFLTKSAFAQCTGSGVAAEIWGEGCENNRCYGPEGNGQYFTITTTCSGSSASNCRRPFVISATSCQDLEPSGCLETGSRVDEYTNFGCSWTGSSPSQCSSYPGLLQSCGGAGQCCSGGTTCARSACASGSYRCLNPGCGPLNSSACNYAVGCCSPYEPNSFSVCACPSVNPPNALSPLNGLVCPGNQNLTWNGSAPKYNLRVDAPLSLDYTTTCNKPSGKDGVNGECVDGLKKTKWKYDFTRKGQDYRWWVHSNNTCGLSAPREGNVTVAEDPGDPLTLKFGGQSPLANNTITIPPGSTTISWGRPTNYALIKDLEYQVRIDDSINGWSGCNPASNPNDVCQNQTGLDRNYTYNFQAGRSYAVRIVSQSPCAGLVDGTTARIYVNQNLAGTQPTAPNNIQVEETNNIDPNTTPNIQTRDIQVRWTAPSSWGVASPAPNSNNYALVIKTVSGTAPTAPAGKGPTPTPPPPSGTEIYRVENIPGGQVLFDTADACPAGASCDPVHPLKANAQYQVQVCARNVNISNFDGTCSAPVIFTKQPYRTGTFTGNYWLYNTSASPKCMSPGALNNPSFTLNGTNFTTPTCDGDSSSYTCSFELDNINADPNPSNTIANLSINNIGAYNGLYCPTAATVCSAGGNPVISTCTSPQLVSNFTLDRNVANVAVTQDIYMDPGIVSYYKFKNASYYSRSVINSAIPTTPQAYDSDDNTQKRFIIGDLDGTYEGVGVVTSTSSTGTNFGSATPPSGKVTEKSWLNTSYIPNPTTYLAFKSRALSSGATLISNMGSNPFGSETTGIWVYTPPSGTLNIDASAGSFDPAWLSGKSIVLIVDGDVNINQNIDPSANGYVAIVAKKIIIKQAATYLRGIFAADDIDLDGATDINPLKIRGNLVSFQPPTNLNMRARSTLSQPSLFVVFDPVHYIKLLSNIATPIRTFKIKQ